MEPRIHTEPESLPCTCGLPKPPRTRITARTPTRLSAPGATRKPTLRHAPNHAVTIVREEQVIQVSGHSLAKCSLVCGRVPLKFRHDGLEVGEIRRKFSGSLFEHCELAFRSSLAVRVVVSAVEDVSVFFDGVEFDSVIDDVGVDHSVISAFEKGRDEHHLVLVTAELPGVACQFSS